MDVVRALCRCRTLLLLHFAGRSLLGGGVAAAAVLLGVVLGAEVFGNFGRADVISLFVRGFVGSRDRDKAE